MVETEYLYINSKQFSKGNCFMFKINRFLTNSRNLESLIFNSDSSKCSLPTLLRPKSKAILSPTTIAFWACSSNFVKKYDVDDKNIYEDIKRLFGTNDDQPFYMEYSDAVKSILEAAMEITNQQNKSKVTLNILTIALLQSEESVAHELLKKYKVDFEEIIYQLNESSELETKLDQIQSLVNLNKKVKQGEHLIVGRQKELEKLCMILSKKEKNNALIIGEAGVGKSALVEKLAYLINQKQVNEGLKKKIIYELSLSSIVAPIIVRSFLAKYGFKILAASIAPSAPPAPIILWISSIKMMTFPFPLPYQ